MNPPIEQIMRDLDCPLCDEDRIEAAAKIVGLDRIIEIQRLRIMELESAVRNSNGK